MQQYIPGDMVQAEYKSGQYVGEVLELTSSKAAVRVAAVLRHPAQGDLHHPGEADVALFHQRRALAFGEIALMPLASLSPFTEGAPDYRASLQAALSREMEHVRGLEASPDVIRYAQRALRELEALATDYGLTESKS